MKAPLLLLVLSAMFSCSMNVVGQEIPGENAGDIGWTIVDQDTLVLVRAADGHAWLQQNLGASEVATATNAATAYGDLYQWGRWKDGHQLRTSTTAPASTLLANDPTGLGLGSPFFYIGSNPSDWWSAGSSTDTWQGTVATASNGISPCTALGPDWELPSQADWMNVLAMEGISGNASALASNLKLPAAGSRDGQSGTLINGAQFGNYWSSTASGLYAKDVTIGDGFVNADDDAYRSYGMCVRCINKSLHVGVLEHKDDPALALFPNPSNGTFTVQGPSVITAIVIYDALSKMVATIPAAGTTATVSLTDLQNGVYFVRIGTVQGTYSRSISVQR